MTEQNYIVTGNTQIGWSMTVRASSPGEAEEKAKDHWNWNTTYEDIVILDTYNAETGEHL